jgi:PTH2 family peptidyl-tRNA hydrolase
MSGGIMSNIKMVIAVRKDLSMRKGKLAAQVAHASMKFLTDNNESERGDELYVKLSPEETVWMTGSFTKIVVGVESQDALEHLMFLAQLEGIEAHSVVDLGKTEFNGIPTLTCAAFGPCEEEQLNKLTGHLKLL